MQCFAFYISPNCYAGFAILICTYSLPPLLDVQTDPICKKSFAVKKFCIYLQDQLKKKFQIKKFPLCYSLSIHTQMYRVLNQLKTRRATSIKTKHCSLKIKQTNINKYIVEKHLIFWFKQNFLFE